MFVEQAQCLFEDMFRRFQHLEHSLGWDIDEREGVIELKVPQIPSVYLMHRHDTLEQIWLSSPISGGWHFIFDAQRQGWYDTRANQPFVGMVFGELKSYIPCALWESVRA